MSYVREVLGFSPNKKPKELSVIPIIPGARLFPIRYDITEVGFNLLTEEQPEYNRFPGVKEFFQAYPHIFTKLIEEGMELNKISDYINSADYIRGMNLMAWMNIVQAHEFQGDLILHEAPGEIISVHTPEREAAETLIPYANQAVAEFLKQNRSIKISLDHSMTGNQFQEGYKTSLGLGMMDFAKISQERGLIVPRRLRVEMNQYID